ncbi:MAG: hypothetical protein JSR80_06035, partial [Verrucomicrobia bacterium]|nr:hypothetical protein [Verrucomicrobiota bacterium]
MQRKMSFSLEQYSKERQQLTPVQIDALFERGEAWHLAPSFQKGGSAIFPHTFISPCGPQIAAVVKGCFESGAERVIALGVFHALEATPSPGVMGPGLRASEAWRREFSLETFCFLWDQWLLRNGGKGPHLLLRYPFGIWGVPEELPGMRELSQEAKGALVVATSDLCHHG